MNVVRGSGSLLKREKGRGRYAGRRVMKRRLWLWSCRRGCCVLLSTVKVELSTNWPQCGRVGRGERYTDPLSEQRIRDRKPDDGSRAAIRLDAGLQLQSRDVDDECSTITE